MFGTARGAAAAAALLEDGVAARRLVAAHGRAVWQDVALEGAGRNAAGDHLMPTTCWPPVASAHSAASGPALLMLVLPAGATAGLPDPRRSSRAASRWGRGSKPTRSSARSASGPRLSTAFSGKASKKARARLGGLSGPSSSSTALSVSGCLRRRRDMAELAETAGLRALWALGKASGLSVSKRSKSSRRGLNAASRATRESSCTTGAAALAADAGEDAGVLGAAAATV
mmetsp:Transcript_28036/g.75725  ORF Transcript_28036/g.75725 Transcript_28036/m.75725 type:complete len:229 (-) Transcript_28036:1362-2048(-)